MPSRKKSSPKDQDIESILDHIRPEFLEQGARKISEADVGMLVESADAIAEHFAQGGTLDRFAQDAQMLLSLASDYSEGRYRQAPYWSIAVITFALLYVMKPVDIIPDILPVVGQLDDAIVLSHCLIMTKNDLYRYKVWKVGRQTEERGNKDA